MPGARPSLIGVTETLLTFGLAALLLAMVPGPGTFLVIRNTLRGGRRAALLTTTGNAAGLLVWALAAAAGLSALVAASQLAYDAIRVVGAVVLVGLGLQSLLTARGGRATGEEHADDEPTLSGRSAFRAGLATNLANPKAAVFAVAFYPQFIPDDGAVLPWVVGLAVLQIALSSSWYTLLAWSVDRAHRLLARATVRRRLEQASGGVLVGLGAAIAAGRA